ncbi:non-hydrolyzing UDP-N-acetylglucosamine 2-epimerase [Conexibacter woesei]|uniref:UDP-N-acetylglucosamine 2-epimerase n=1 Tax=Conexibacter woesei (strain DSM 14684 / CCUG 47730 / CIP 108061 / JCM 11494 / NBRC 100937 / ID131577) TaxID=469383 RepID=D3F3U2_CONWI|nr:UDP-N-acetylglucosamine 2-epimerase (non-hydrolyzing) [Conexibacter woesei]ADB54317.1 UDP-N-acetylglucosamine 2-epimerase [Conexibacter woesei DSM 14684]
MRILTVIGNRPQFIKASAVSSRLRSRAEEITVHTGQHYDRELSQVFFDELKLPPPEHLLGIGGGTNTGQTARMLAALEPLLADVRPDAVLVYGDTNSTLAGALAAVQAGVPVAHVEAGMRSFDRSMPEEVNRVVTDHLSRLLLVPSQTAVENLRRESVDGTVELVGDVMVDVALLLQPGARARTDTLAPYGVEQGGYVLATAHRAGNVDDPARLAQLVALLLSLDRPTVFPLHPRTRARLVDAGLLAALEQADHMRLAKPLGYLDFTALLCNAHAVLTDSGGVQKEAYLAGVPCVTMRPNTEWVETVEAGWNVLVDLDAAAAAVALERIPPPERPQLYGDGEAGERVATAVALLT